MRELGGLVRWGIRGLRRGVRLLEGLRLLDRRRIDVCDVIAAVAVALDAEDDEQDPGSKLEDTTDHKHSNSAIELAHIAADTRVVGIVGAVV
jgi:hypothetical protein